jgi:hypothetical protein
VPLRIPQEIDGLLLLDHDVQECLSCDHG